MKILLATDCYLPAITGVTTAITTLAHGLTARGHEVFLMSPNLPALTSPNGHFFKVASLPFPTYHPLRLAFATVGRLRREMASLHFDIVHAHTPFGTGVTAHKIATERKIPCLYTHHTLYPDYLYYIKPFDQISHDKTTHYIRRYCDAVDRVVTQTHPVKSLLLRDGVTNSIDVIPLGVDPTTVRPTAKTDLHRRYGIPAEVPIVLFVGRIAVEKNFPWMIEALEEATRRGIPFHGLIVGDGPYRKALKKLVDTHHLQDRVTLTGYVSQEELMQCYANGDLFCMPSLVESQCLAAIEAMMNGVPVVAVRAMGLQETISHGVNGLLCEPNPTALAETVCHLLQNDAERARLRVGAARVATQMTADRYVESYVTLYRDLIGKGIEEGRPPLKIWPLIFKSILLP